MPLNIETYLPSLEQLPSTYAISLSHYNAISLAGDEQSKYLQGQVTCDVNSSTEHSLLIGAHCNAKGKVFSAFRLINRGNAHLLIQPKATLDISIRELKKFGVFAKVEITRTDNLSFYALVGAEATQILQNNFSRIPDSLNPVVQSGSTSLVYIAGNQNRYLLIDEAAILEPIMTQIKLPVFPNSVWNLLEINDGFVQLASEASGEYVPQMLNLQAINGISFTKGCYLGQETVARMQYLGKNKRALYSLKFKTNTPFSSDDAIEKQLGDNWRKAGEVLSCYQSEDGTSYVQAILGSDVENTTSLRLKSQPDVVVTIQPLPYSLVSE